MADAWNRIDEEAAAWLIRLRTDASGADWEAFTAWLEADPAHGAAYDLIALADLELDDLPLAKPAPLVFQPEPRRSRRAFLGWGGAAVAAAVVGAITLMPSGASTYEVATGTGERRTVALDDGSRIELNGATRLVLDRDNPRFARVEQGEALFTVVHDTARPFRVEAGQARLHDLGTVFNVIHDGERTDVAVAEGAVRWQRGDSRVDLAAGMALSQRGGARPIVTRETPANIGGWREGRLSYSGARYDMVAADLSRNLGTRVSIDDRAAARQFSGVIVIDRNPAVTMQRVGALLEVRPQRAGDGWNLSVGGGATR
ncbi:FecR domain-containing protein [Sphingosinicella sp. LHD-64]|uniref:FecR family protein n=1 Tax=Sphingosinicella sp. LHD-64 TaxID=3072139 RepID=UPI00280D57C6|nr:FecR domain-containing protein [Sphingosinicella sp. LHD-64]MDQ8754626.1 FecR domain-containing protein [Sphingosinicella sp. LHD-64]